MDAADARERTAPPGVASEATAASFGATRATRAFLAAPGIVWRHRLWLGLIGLNLALGALLWLFHLTDLSFPGSVPDVVFPALAAIVALATWRLAGRWAAGRGTVIGRACCVPSLLGGGLHLVAYTLALCGIVLVPWALGRLVFAIDEIVDERVVQRVWSPDGSRVAEVYYRAVGQPSANFGRVLVRVRHRWLPMVERDVYFVGGTRAVVGETAEFVRWEDDQVLYVPETQEAIVVGSLRAQPSPLVAVPLGWAATLWRLLDPGVAAPLAAVPRFPGAVEDRLDFQVARNTFSQIIRVPRRHPDDVVDWYRETLVAPTWKVVGERVSRRPAGVPGRNWLRYCLETLRWDGENQPRAYYVEIAGFDVNPSNTWINAATPNPSDGCLDYILPRSAD